MNTVASAPAPLAGRLWTYQRERFPLAAYVPLIGISALSAAAYSAAAWSRPGLPPWPVLLVGLATALVFFFLLRVADEHKDADVDRQFRPELPVPRGLVSLAELRRAGAAVALAAALANAIVAPRLLLALVPAVVWAGLMAREFFVAEWLRARSVAYLLSHMVIMPLLFAYLTGLDWLAAGADPPRGLPLFLGLAFLNGILVEVGRKIRAPETERVGVETYTTTWGLRAAPAAWLGALALAAVLGWLASRPTGAGGIVAIGLAVMGVAAALPAIGFLRRPTAARGKRIETASGLWTLASYLLLGFAPLIGG
jgi:4-hydroxybenzoate polyprenyltransferase